MKHTLEDVLKLHFDGEILCPFFLEGGRYTASDIHYVADHDRLIPAGQTEFAKDKTFGYQASDLKEYIEEKTQGEVKADSVASISLEMLRNEDYYLIYNILMGLHDYGHVIVNALDYADLEVFAIAYYRAIASGKRFLIRSSASLVRVPVSYTHLDVYKRQPQKRLSETLDGVVEDCVNTVGVDLNTASPSLLKNVAGITPTIAKNIVAYREENGAFHSRAELKKVSKLGPKAFEQCAGFLRVPESDNRCV